MLVQIIATPAGGAPEHIRRAWVGMKLPVVATPSAGVTSYAEKLLGGPVFIFTINDVVRAMEDRHPDAYWFWVDAKNGMLPWKHHKHLIALARVDCQVVSP